MAADKICSSCGKRLVGHGNTFFKCPKCGAAVPGHTACPQCGTYKTQSGAEVIVKLVD